jgi:hypothetical protein
MSLQVRRLKTITLTIGTVSVECQLNSWTLDPGTKDGDRLYTFCPDGVAIEETDNEPTLQVKLFSDWRSDGFSDFLWANPNVVADFTLDHHPDIATEHVRWTGQVLIKPAPVGGDARDNEETDITLQVIGEPVYARV